MIKTFIINFFGGIIEYDIMLNKKIYDDLIKN